MELLQKQTAIYNYIKNNFKLALSERYGEDTDLDAYIQDFVNLDKYQKSKQMFFDWSNYSFDTLSLDSMVETVELHLILTFRNDTPTNLHNKMMEYAPILYNTITESDGFNGLVDIVEVTNIEFYEATDTDQNIKVADLTVNMRDEIR